MLVSSSNTFWNFPQFYVSGSTKKLNFFCEFFKFLARGVTTKNNWFSRLYMENLQYGTLQYGSELNLILVCFWVFFRGRQFSAVEKPCSWSEFDLHIINYQFKLTRPYSFLSNLCIQSECKKMWTRNNFVFGLFSCSVS